MDTLVIVLGLAAVIVLFVFVRRHARPAIHPAIERMLPPEAPRPPYNLTSEDNAAVDHVTGVFLQAGVMAEIRAHYGPFGPTKEIHFLDVPSELNPVASLSRVWDRDQSRLVSMWMFGGEVDGKIEQEVLGLGFVRLSPAGTAPSIFTRS